MDHRTNNPRRRRMLMAAAGAGAAALLAQGAARPASATPESAKALLRSFATAEPREGRIVIRAPEIAENGNAVPITVTVDSPMTDKDHVRAIHVVADGNPSPGVASFKLSPLAGKAEIQLRVRMASTQKIIVLAEMSDGSLWTQSREIKVTLGGCGG